MPTPGTVQSLPWMGYVSASRTTGTHSFPACVFPHSLSKSARTLRARWTRRRSSAQHRRISTITSSRLPRRGEVLTSRSSSATARSAASLASAWSCMSVANSSPKGLPAFAKSFRAMSVRPASRASMPRCRSRSGVPSVPRRRSRSATVRSAGRRMCPTLPTVWPCRMACVTWTPPAPTSRISQAILPPTSSTATVLPISAWKEERICSSTPATAANCAVTASRCSSASPAPKASRLSRQCPRAAAACPVRTALASAAMVGSGIVFSAAGTAGSTTGTARSTKGTAGSTAATAGSATGTAGSTAATAGSTTGTACSATGWGVSVATAGLVCGAGTAIGSSGSPSGTVHSGSGCAVAASANGVAPGTVAAGGGGSLPTARAFLSPRPRAASATSRTSSRAEATAMPRTRRDGFRPATVWSGRCASTSPARTRSRSASKARQSP